MSVFRSALHSGFVLRSARASRAAVGTLAGRFSKSNVRGVPPRVRAGLTFVREVGCAQLQSIMLKSSIKCTSAQAERFGGFAGISVVSRERFLDKKNLHLLETHLFEAPWIVSTGR